LDEMKVQTVRLQSGRVRDYGAVSGFRGPSGCWSRPTVPRPMFIDGFAHFNRPKRRPLGSLDPSLESGEGTVHCLKLTEGLDQRFKTKAQTTHAVHQAIHLALAYGPSMREMITVTRPASET
jgi:hypothetical protein